MNIPVEGKDFYYNEQGYKVFTEKYHLDRGYCCGNGCRHCPYGLFSPSQGVDSGSAYLSSSVDKSRNEKNDQEKNSSE